MIERDATLVVTGAGGYIGSKLIDTLRRTKYRAVALNRDDWDVAAEYSLDNPRLPRSPELVLHLAAEVGVQKSWREPDYFFKTNVLGTRSVLEYCRASGASLVYVSAYTYASSCTPPVDESGVIAASNPYAQTKYIAEELCRFYYNSFGVRSVIARPFNVFGGNQGNDFLIPEVITQVSGESEVIEVQDSSPIRDYIYIQDLVDALIGMAEGLLSGTLGSCDVFNVGTGTGSSVEEVVQVIQKVWSTNKTLKTLNRPRRNEIPISIANIGKIQRELGWTPKYSLEKGLQEMLRG